MGIWKMASEQRTEPGSDGFSSCGGLIGFAAICEKGSCRVQFSGVGCDRFRLL